MHGLFDDGGFQAALLASVALCGVGMLFRRSVVIGWTAIALAGAIVGLRYEHRIGPTLVWALLLLVAGGLAARRSSPVVQMLVCTPGAVVLAQAVSDRATTWMRLGAVIGTVVAAPLVLACARRRSHLAPLLLTVTTIGVLVCVPETGAVHCALGALLPAVLYGVVVLDADPAFAFPLVGLLVWATVGGGATRPGSVVGGLACFGLLLLPLLLRRVAWWSALTVQVALVLFVARVAGFEESAWPALALALAAFVLAAVAIVVLGRVQRAGASAR